MITGKPCVDFLDDWTQWNEAYSLSSVLLAIQVWTMNIMLSRSMRTRKPRINTTGHIDHAPFTRPFSSCSLTDHSRLADHSRPALARGRGRVSFLSGHSWGGRGWDSLLSDWSFLSGPSGGRVGWVPYLPGQGGMGPLPTWPVGMGHSRCGRTKYLWKHYLPS